MTLAKLRQADGGFFHWCPACNGIHYIAVTRPLPNGARWSFDGNEDRPTFTPSVKIQIGWSDIPRLIFTRCHYFITAGEIRFCGDCTHNMKGQTVPLPEIPA